MSTSTSLRKSFAAFLAPMMLSNILQSLHGTINTIYVGQLIGVDALAAASVFFPVMFFFIAFVMGLGSGATVLIGQAWGAGRHEQVRAVAGTTLALALLLAGAIALLGGLFARPLVVALATPPDIIEPAASYARIMMITMPLTFVFILITAMLRGTGDAVTPLIALAMSTAIGLVATPALILGWLDLPRLGVSSAAWGSAASACLTLIWLAVDLRRRKHVLALVSLLRHALPPDLKPLPTILRIGIPAAIGMVVMAVAELVLLGLANSFGSDATAAYGAVNQVMSCVQFPALSISISVSILVAQAIGRGDTEKIGAIVRTGIEMNILLTGGLVALGYLFSRTVIGFFIIDPAVLQLARSLLHIVLWSAVLFGMSTVFSGAMRASGTVWLPLMISAFVIAAIEVPSAFALSRAIGIEGVWVAYPITFSIMLLLQMGYYLLVWRKRRIRRLI